MSRVTDSSQLPEFPKNERFYPHYNRWWREKLAAELAENAEADKVPAEEVQKCPKKLKKPKLPKKHCSVVPNLRDANGDGAGVLGREVSVEEHDNHGNIWSPRVRSHSSSSSSHPTVKSRNLSAEENIIPEDPEDTENPEGKLISSQELPQDSGKGSEGRPETDCKPAEAHEIVEGESQEKTKVDQQYGMPRRSASIRSWLSKCTSHKSY